LGEKEHAEFKAKMFRMSEERIATMDAVLTLNFDKNTAKDIFHEVFGEDFGKGSKNGSK